MKKTITIQTTINAPIDKVWELYTNPIHVVNWNNATDDWHTPQAENDLKKGGKFNYRMEAKDKSAGFDFEGIYDEVRIYELIEYTMGDSRKVRATFIKYNSKTKLIIDFEAETENSLEMQREGWQSILDNFKRYVESS